MGLDITLVKNRKNRIDENCTIEELFKNGKYVSEYRNAWDVLTLLSLTEFEKDNGICYRIVNELPIHLLRECGFKTQEFLETYKNLNRDKFVYILKANW